MACGGSKTKKMSNNDLLKEILKMMGGNIEGE